MIYRAAEPRDLPFVIAVWSSSYKNAHAAGIIGSEDWSEIMHDQLAKLIARPNTTTIVAANGPSFLYGFICGDVSAPMPVVHYVYVKAPYRSQPMSRDGERRGPRYARGLFAALGVDPAAPFIYSCRTAIVPQVADKIPLARFSPAAARYGNYHQHQQEQHDHG